MKGRLQHLQLFYAILDVLEQRLGGARTLAECDGRMDWPRRGLYFFRELGEKRYDTGAGLRIVRVGTHALSTKSQTQLWTRLSQHRGKKANAGGNHRGSIFRLLIGTALMRRDELESATWGAGSSGSPEVRRSELSLEQKVSAVVCAMPFLWLEIGDAPGPSSMRGYIERNAIALLSNYKKKALLDPPSGDWLGLHCSRERVRASGLWNSNHVDEEYDPAFLGQLERLVTQVKGGR